jgi:hypothetical protein
MTSIMLVTVLALLVMQDTALDVSCACSRSALAFVVPACTAPAVGTVR